MSILKSPLPMSANYDRDIESVADLISAADEGVMLMQFVLKMQARSHLNAWHVLCATARIL